jgi:hypothetical protein
MPGKKYAPEDIIAKLRQVDVLVSRGQNIADAVRRINVGEVTYYRWQREYRGLKTEHVKHLHELEMENIRLRKAASGLTLNKLIPSAAQTRRDLDIAKCRMTRSRSKEAPARNRMLF